MIGYFLTDYDVGIYSLASTIAKGLLMISSIIQINFNPIISSSYSKHGAKQLAIYIHKLFKITSFTAIAIVVLAMIGYPFIIHLFVKDASFHASIPVFYILLCGIGVIWAFCFSGAILTMCGYTTEQLQVMTTMLLFNIGCNLLFIPIAGIYGAATATTLSYIVAIILLNYFVQQRIHINLFDIFISSVKSNFYKVKAMIKCPHKQ